MKMLELRGRAALAVGAAAAAEGEACTREAERCASEIEDEGARWGKPLALLLRAGVCAVRGQESECASLLAGAEDGFAVERMGLHVAVSRWRLAECLERTETDRSALLRAAAASWMQEQGIADPGRLAHTIAPFRVRAD
jgi:hypothetical protein